MLSGVGPAAELEKHGIQVKLDNPDVGQNFADHLYTVSYWNVADPAAGWAYGSPGFPTADNYGWGASSDFIVSTGVRDRAGLVAAIEADEGAAPDPATHPLLAADRVFFEHIFNNQGATDGSAVWISSTNLLPTSRGSVTLASAHIGDAPRADPNYLATAVDRFVYRDNLRLEIDFMGGNLTTLATRVLDGEIPPAGFSEGYSVASTDEYIDARVRAGLRYVFLSIFFFSVFFFFSFSVICIRTYCGVCPIRTDNEGTNQTVLATTPWARRPWARLWTPT